MDISAHLFDDVPEYQFFGKHSKVFSLVSKAFREVVVRKGVFNHVVLHSKEQVQKTMRLLGPAVRSLVT
jgi:hypothetical protein